MLYHVGDLWLPTGEQAGGMDAGNAWCAPACMSTLLEDALPTRGFSLASAWSMSRVSSADRPVCVHSNTRARPRALQVQPVHTNPHRRATALTQARTHRKCWLGDAPRKHSGMYSLVHAQTRLHAEKERETEGYIHTYIHTYIPVSYTHLTLPTTPYV